MGLYGTPKLLATALSTNHNHSIETPVNTMYLIINIFQVP